MSHIQITATTNTEVYPRRRLRRRLRCRLQKSLPVWKIPIFNTAQSKSLKIQLVLGLMMGAIFKCSLVKRLTNLSNIVGGMTWCIETCNFDVDVDLLFNENLTIGQKISLTERIVRVLRSMKCPHRLEPHQVQGLDAIHIFPVIQWLVKKALETRAEFGDETRNFSSWQFKQYYGVPEEEKIKDTESIAIKTLIGIQTAYGPKRRWKKKSGLSQEKERVQTTLLEYGRLIGHMGKEGIRTATDDVDAGTDAVQQQQQQEQQMAEMEQLMKNLDVAEAVEGKLSAACVGNIVSARAQEIADSSQHFSELQQQMADEILGEGASSQLRLLSSLEEQKSSKAKELANIDDQYKQEMAKLTQLQNQLKEIQKKKIYPVPSVPNFLLLTVNSRLFEYLGKLLIKDSKSKKREPDWPCNKEGERI
ncbi:unnamed protein product, partial [Meganyctiphanes norvegica]